MGHITAPFQLAPGGYIEKRSVTLNGDWQSVNAEGQTGPVDPDDRHQQRFRPRTGRVSPSAPPAHA